MRPWGRRPLTIPPNSANTWIQLAIWELWMGMLVCAILGLGLLLIATSHNRILTVSDFTNCYEPDAIALHCERLVYRGGVLNAAFTALFGLMLTGVAAWFLWELWSAVEPKPITDDFLKLLNDSFGQSWRNPLKWPWARLFYAYGFTAIGAMLTAGAVMIVLTLVSSPDAAKVPTIKIETSESFSLGR